MTFGGRLNERAPATRANEAAASSGATCTVAARTAASGAHATDTGASAAADHWTPHAPAAHRTSDVIGFGALSAFILDVGTTADAAKVIYWHGDLPPLEAEPIGEHVVEAESARVKGDLAQRDALWDQCHDDLMARLDDRLRQEIARLGGDYAHVLEESIESQRDDAAGEAWLHGRLNYSLLRHQ